MNQCCCPICGAVYVRMRGEWVLETNLKTGGVQVTQRASDRKIKAIVDLQDEGLTQSEIAERVGTSQQLVSIVEAANGTPRRRRKSFADSATGFRAKVEAMRSRIKPS